ncbi:hypothetical protein NDU88_005561 [Pleurodeles waltl]|uniref:Uncharacterized protein n=1 Tax=Pleurodeles waltl TaxID=8319 RepID=A0AAV7MYG0_PLEWA|nr:hypothetical protein NDU88_005561 [Pleurodeles waltl]
MVTASGEGWQVTRNVSWFRKVVPQVGDSGPGLEEENGEEFEGSCPLLPSTPNECRRGGGGVSRRSPERPLFPNPRAAGRCRSMDQSAPGRPRNFNFISLWRAAEAQSIAPSQAGHGKMIQHLPVRGDKKVGQHCSRPQERR